MFHVFSHSNLQLFIFFIKTSISFGDFLAMSPTYWRHSRNSLQPRLLGAWCSRRATRRCPAQFQYSLLLLGREATVATALLFSCEQLELKIIADLWSLWSMDMLKWSFMRQRWILFLWDGFLRRVNHMTYVLPYFSHHPFSFPFGWISQLFQRLNSQKFATSHRYAPKLKRFSFPTTSFYGWIPIFLYAFFKYIYIYTIYYVSAFSLLHPLNLHLPVAYHTANWKLQLKMVPKRYPNLSLVNGSWFPRSKSGGFLKWRYPLASSILFSDLPLQTVQLLKFWGVSPKKNRIMTWGIPVSFGNIWGIPMTWGFPSIPRQIPWPKVLSHGPTVMKPPSPTQGPPGALGSSREKFRGWAGDFKVWGCSPKLGGFHQSWGGQRPWDLGSLHDSTIECERGSNIR